MRRFGHAAPARIEGTFFWPTWRAETVYAGPSRISGRGLIAAADIPQATVVAVRGGEIVRLSEALRRDEWGYHSLQLWIPGGSADPRTAYFLCPRSAEDSEEVSLFLNHRCRKPNLGFAQPEDLAGLPAGHPAMRLAGREYLLGRAFKTLVDVEAGEELCPDYAMGQATPYRQRCTCGSQACRKVITGDDWRWLAARYRGALSPVIAALVEQSAEHDNSAWLSNYAAAG